MAAYIRTQREAQRRLRELERQAKEIAKHSALEDARLAVETFENSLEVLISIHKERQNLWDWLEVATRLAPSKPFRLSPYETKALQKAALSKYLGEDPAPMELFEARTRDEQAFQELAQAHARDFAEWESLKSLAGRIRAGEKESYLKALVEFGGFGEISLLGSSVHFAVVSRDLLKCTLKVNGWNVIPNQQKTLTATGKLSIKPMPRPRFHELYQDHVCSCVLRIARESFALLPFKTVLVTALVTTNLTGESQKNAQPVLSVAFARGPFEQLDFDSLDPSDAIELFHHRGDARASRRSGEFEIVTPLDSEDLPKVPANPVLDEAGLLPRVRALLEDINQLRDSIGRLSLARKSDAIL